MTLTALVIGGCSIFGFSVTFVITRLAARKAVDKGVKLGMRAAERIALNQAYRSGASSEFGPEQNCIRVAEAIRKAREEYAS